MLRFPPMLNHPKKEDPDRILIIDDDLATLLAIPALIRPYFPEAIIQTAINGDAALNWLRDYRYRLILLDIRLPGIDGLTLLKEFRESFGTAQVIVMTGAVDDKVKAEALKTGVYAFLEKPVSPKPLIETIEAALKDSSQ
jgi:two-component system nitrogen regulation response regulator NtrX